MKNCRLWLCLLAASLASASAQVTVEVTQDQNQFLLGESLPVAVRITNRSGQPLTLGAEQDWLTFSVETPEGSVVPKVSDAPLAGEFVLDSSKVAIKRVDLAPYFSFTHIGRYSITASVRIRAWGRDVESRPKFFDVIDGAKLWEQEVGIPGSGHGGTGEPELRKYMLQQANYIRGQLRLYLRVTDSYGRTLRVFPIGPMVSFGRPEPQVDRLSNLHVLYQYSASLFSYFVFNLNGDIVTRQTYDYVDSRPRLRMSDDGTISVVGGVRRPNATDVPPFDPSATNVVPADVVGNLTPTNTVSTAKP